jgi:hypothetical protein
MIIRVAIRMLDLENTLVEIGPGKLALLIIIHVIGCQIMISSYSFAVKETLVSALLFVFYWLLTMFCVIWGISTLDKEGEKKMSAVDMLFNSGIGVLAFMYH